MALLFIRLEPLPVICAGVTMNVLITGAAGNLGSLLTGCILKREKDLSLILMQHLKRVSADLSAAP